MSDPDPPGGGGGGDGDPSSGGPDVTLLPVEKLVTYLKQVRKGRETCILWREIQTAMGLLKIEAEKVGSKSVR